MARPKKRARKAATTKRESRAKASRAKKSNAPPRAARLSNRETRIDHALVARTLDLVADHERTTTESMRGVGAAIIEDYFGGDLELASSNDPLKPKSFTKLSDIIGDETTWTADDLRNAVKVEVVAGTLPSTLANRIAPTYLAHLHTVDDPAKRIELATDLASGTLRGRAAREAITRASGANPRGGRPPLPGPQRVVGTLERMLDRAEEGGDLDAEDFHRIADTARDALRRRVRRVIDRLQVLWRRLDR